MRTTSTVLHSLFGYHAWANQELLDVIGQLNIGQHAIERQQALRLLNHVLVVGNIFRAHLSAKSHGYADTNTEDTPSLGALRKSLEALDAWYEDYVAEADAVMLAEPIAFGFTDGDAGCMSREEVLLHVATHAGYHRGEVGHMLRPLGVELPWDTYAVYLHRSQSSRRAVSSDVKSRLTGLPA